MIVIRKIFKTCNVPDGFNKIASAVCTVLFSNKLMQVLNYDGIAIQSVSTISSYRVIRFSQLIIYSGQ